MRIFKSFIRSRKSEVINFLTSTFCILLSVFFLSACHDTIEYYKRGESYASEKINGEVNNVLDCDDENKGKSYCDDSATNREKQHQTKIADQEVISQAHKAEAKIQPSQTPMQVSKGPISPEPGKESGSVELKPLPSGGTVITPLTPEEKIVAPAVKKPEVQAKKKSAPKKTVKKKPTKKPIKKKPVKKKIQKPVEKPKEREKPKEIGGSNGNQGAVPSTGPVVDKPLLPSTTDDMLGIDKISP